MPWLSLHHAVAERSPVAVMSLKRMARACAGMRNILKSQKPKMKVACADIVSSQSLRMGENATLCVCISQLKGLYACLPLMLPVWLKSGRILSFAQSPA